MKRILCALLSGAVIIGSLAGCGADKETSAGGKKKITFVTNKTDIVDTTLRDYADKFEKENPDIAVELEAVSDYYRVLQTRAAAGEMPDVSFLIAALKSDSWQDYYMPLDDIGISGDLYFKDTYSYNGHLYAIPFQMNYSGVVYNKKVFEKAGITEVPKTLDELYDACEKIKAIGVVPTTPILKSTGTVGQYVEYLAPMYGKADYQSDIVGKENPFTVNSPVGKALTVLRTLYDRGYFEEDLLSYTPDGMKKDLASGKLGWEFSQTWLVPQVISNGGNSDDIGFFPMPYDNSGTIKTLLKPDWRLTIAKDTKQPEAAKTFLKYVMDTDYEEFLRVCGGAISSRPSKTFNLIPQFAEFEEYKPEKVECVVDPDSLKAVFNKAQIKWDDMAHDAILMDSVEACLDKYNKLWNGSLK